MTRRLPTALVTIALLLAGAAPALAQMPCAPRKDVVRYLGKTFGEVPAMNGLADFGALMEVLVSPQGTWTLIVTAPSGEACVVATGQHWQPVAPDRGEPQA